MESVNYSKVVRMLIKTRLHVILDKIHVISIQQQIMELQQHSVNLIVVKQ